MVTKLLYRNTDEKQRNDALQKVQAASRLRAYCLS